MRVCPASLRGSPRGRGGGLLTHTWRFRGPGCDASRSSSFACVPSARGGPAGLRGPVWAAAPPGARVWAVSPSRCLLAAGSRGGCVRGCCYREHLILRRRGSIKPARPPPEGWFPEGCGGPPPSPCLHWAVGGHCSQRWAGRAASLLRSDPAAAGRGSWGERGMEESGPQQATPPGGPARRRRLPPAPRTHAPAAVPAAHWSGPSATGPAGGQRELSWRL